MIEYKHDATTKEIQEQGLRILSEFHRLCEKHNLRYILDFGTLLGAVRHQGFIPWDDDIDVAMPRKDYLKLKEVVDELPSDMFLQIHETDKNYYLPFPKIRIENKKYTELKLAHLDIKHGPWIDIFVYDYKFDDFNREKEKQTEFNKRRNYYDFITPTIYYKEAKNQNFLKTAVKKLVLFILKKSQASDNRGLIMKYLDHKYDKLNELIKESPTENESGEMMLYVSKIDETNTEQVLTLNIDDFKNRELSDFKEEQFYIPKNYHEILTRKYGDYRKLPPYEERVGGHNLVNLKI